MHLHRKLLAGGLLAIVFASASPVAAALQASVDRAEILPGETITLTLEQDDPTAVAEPDLRQLEENFQILDVRRSQHVTIVNGDRSESSSWVVVLLPNDASVTRIPPIRAGRQTTAAIPIATRPPAAEEAGSRPALFVEAELEESEGFVGAELIYTVRVYDQGKMQSGTLRPPEIPGAEIETSGESSNRQVILDGQRYSLHEQRFRITPQESGTLQIAPAILEARMQPKPDENRRRSRGFFSDFFDRVGQSGPLRRVASNPVSLEIRARPDATEGWFLPAKVVQLDEAWSAESGALSYGEALTRTVSLRVLGASSEQLPAFVIPGPTGARQYAEGTRNGTRPTEDGTISVREESVTIIPEGPGALEFPAVEVKWFDVDAQEPRVARLEARTFQVLPAAGQTEAALPRAGSPVAVPDNQNVAPRPATALAQPGWVVALGTAGLLAIIVLAALGVRHRRHQRFHHGRDKAPSPRLLVREVLRACRESNPQQARSALLQWAAAALPDPRPATLVALGNRLGEDHLMAALRDLDRCLYGREPQPWSGTALAAAFRPLARRHAKSRKQTRPAPLPSLYPSP